MLVEFAHLSGAEIDLVLKAPVLTCILIAGADGKIDQKEINEALNLGRKNVKKSAKLMEYYKLVSEDFEDKLKIMIQNYPSSAQERNERIVHELKQLNQVFPKINKVFARDLYKSMLEIATKIAQSSGGLLGINKIGQEEAKYINLPMIEDPATY